MEWDDTAENCACKNSSTEPTGQLIGSSWQLPNQEVKVHFKGCSFFMEGTLDLSMDPATSVEGPEPMSNARSGATSTVQKLGRGNAPPERGDPS